MVGIGVAEAKQVIVTVTPDLSMQPFDLRTGQRPRCEPVNEYQAASFKRLEQPPRQKLQPAAQHVTYLLGGQFLVGGEAPRCNLEAMVESAVFPSALLI